MTEYLSHPMSVVIPPAPASGTIDVRYWTARLHEAAEEHGRAELNLSSMLKSLAPPDQKALAEVAFRHVNARGARPQGGFELCLTPSRGAPGELWLRHAASAQRPDSLEELLAHKQLRRWLNSKVRYERGDPWISARLDELTEELVPSVGAELLQHAVSRALQDGWLSWVCLPDGRSFLNQPIDIAFTVIGMEQSLGDEGAEMAVLHVEAGDVQLALAKARRQRPGLSGAFATRGHVEWRDSRLESVSVQRF